MSRVPLPKSILDTDLYKMTMQQAVLHHFPNVQGSYKFTLRDKSALFTRHSVEIFQDTVNRFGELVLSDDELVWMRTACPYFTDAYLNHLKGFRFDPVGQVRIRFVPSASDPDRGHVDIDIEGPWVDTILWEVPLMATLSEVYFTLVDTEWNYEGQADLAFEKGLALLKNDCVFSEFGTRRRRSFEAQDIVVQGLVKACNEQPSQGRLAGTSNVYLAYKHRLVPVGTIAHEWFMGIAALRGYENANSLAMDLWEEVYPKALLIALTDTFSSKAFFQNYVGDKERANRWQGLRQDSGDPFEFGLRCKSVFESLGIDPKSKTIIYSDALDIEKSVQLKKQADEIGLNVSFGIGTFLTNDFKNLSGKKSKALNMVIKLSAADGRPCVKISDDLTKNTGDSETVRLVKKIFDLQ